MRVELTDKVGVITGGSTGIGAATAIAFADAGAKVVIGDINEVDGLKTVDVIKKNGGEAKYVSTDVTDEEQVSNLMHITEESYGGIHTLVTSAGVLQGASVRIDDFEAATFDTVIDVNLKGTFYAIKHAVPVMERSGGVILCIASGAGVRGGSSSVAYASSKGGVNGLVMTVEGQVGGNIRMHTICPGGLSTPLKLGQIAQSAKLAGNDPDAAVEQAMSSLGDPGGVGKVLTFLASDEASYIRGQIFTR